MQVYVIERPDGLVKIGKSGNPTSRINHLENQGGFRSTRAWFSIPGALPFTSECRAHQVLREYRTVGEWFDMDFDKAVDTVAACGNPETAPEPTALDKLGLFIKSYGGLPLAKTLGVSESLVSSWRHGRYPIPPVKCLEIQRLSAGAVKAAELRPEIFSSVTGDSDMDKFIDILARLSTEHRAQALRMLQAFTASLDDNQ
jgi:hypothetical protein